MQRSGGRRDGCATFWRARRLHATHVRCVRFHDYDLSDNVALLVALAPARAAGGAAAAEQPQPGIEPEGGGGGAEGGGGEGGGEEGAEDVGLLVANTHVGSMAAFGRSFAGLG